MANKLFSVHAHFYQPPREDPITGLVPDEAGAAPYKNWNERIQAECYKPNAEKGNFERISFNVGPTLFEWMAVHDPSTAAKIIEQDRANVRRHGVGNAIAQAYNHTILPLASYEDKVTQVAWGIADFEHRFGRKPQGMWLPETAADLETLSVLANHGIAFTILAPWQADSRSLDPLQPYKVALPEGRTITVFFYHADLSSRISFDQGATSNADFFVNVLLKNYFSSDRPYDPQFLLMASDGELYGHHQTFRDLFLSHLVNGASTHAGLQRSYPALWLKRFNPQQFMSIRSKTSWSCHHGVLRWMGDCGCLVEDGVWKYYLRRAFDKLATQLNRVYLEAASPLVDDPWELRSRYIQVVLGAEAVDDLIHRSSKKDLTQDEVQKLSLLLRAQYERQRMFTSCGWYFEDFSRIEPRNNVAYAAQAVRLTRQASGIDLAPKVMADLKRVVSHNSGLSGDVLFRRQLQRAEQTSLSAQA
jgi:alpha-amylase/alpha-mannosidase (GH57 family)